MRVVKSPLPLISRLLLIGSLLMIAKGLFGFSLFEYLGCLF